MIGVSVNSSINYHVQKFEVSYIVSHSLFAMSKNVDLKPPLNVLIRPVEDKEVSIFLVIS